MLIGGFQPVTLLDYPNKLAAIIFAAGCNMRCPFCYNPRLVLPELIDEKNLYQEKNVLEFLKKRKKYLEGVVITGGEPTIQNDLIDFIKKLKKIGYLIKLDTNGLNFKVLSGLIKERLIDYVAMDIKGNPDNYEKFCGVPNFSDIFKSIELIKESNLPYEFRSTLVKGLHKIEDIKKMSELVSGAEIYYLQNYRPEEKTVGENKLFKGFTQSELRQFKLLAQEKVKKCLIRND